MNSTRTAIGTVDPQKIMVFQQNDSGESKIAGVRKYGGNQITLEVISIDKPLPPIIEDSSEYLPHSIQADLVLDFLKHPDLSHDLAGLCCKQNIPLVASGKNLEGAGIHTPPT